MTQLQPKFRAHLETTLLGRLKLGLFAHITNKENELPDARVVRQFILQTSRDNIEVGKLFGPLLNLKACAKTTYDKLPDGEELLAALGSLEDDPLDDAFFLEISNCPQPFAPTTGVFAYCEQLAAGGWVYVVTLVSEEHFPDLLSRYEIRASRNAPEPAFSLLGHDGFQRVGLDEYRTVPIARFLARVAVCIANNRPNRLLHPSETLTLNIEERADCIPPEDPKCDALLKQLVTGQIACSEVEVSMADIVPHSLDFALSMPTDVVDDATKFITRRQAPPLLLYWLDGKFWMSDCYPTYIALRKLERRTVLAVVMGAFPNESAIRTLRVGGVELLPPVRVCKDVDNADLDPELKGLLLDARLRHERLSDSNVSLYCTYLELASILQRRSVLESDVHAFLKRHPIALDAYGNQLRSEVRLGDQYRVDLVVQQSVNNCRIVLVELESPRKIVFTKTGRLRAEITHALQQVEDWLRWWRESPGAIPHGLDARLPVQGQVVVGRSSEFTDDERHRLLSLNATRQVQLITYDDLLDRMESMIFNLENNAT